ncbi:hypothetical protein RB195_011350 [Necator americanus]|uniref:C2H2-type domain-containing protein n=1 Tax=Necator americanus TaxID=51031 RepID=A0ABR1D1Y6_NECAM
MDDVLNKDRAAFVRQLEDTNPDCRIEAQYAPSIDFTKHVRNLSHGQDIPIDNDGRTAILLAHAPSLERLLEMWRDRIDGERHDRKEKKRQRKVERRESRQRRRAEKRKLKESPELETGIKLYKHDCEEEFHGSHVQVRNSKCTSEDDVSSVNCQTSVVKNENDVCSSTDREASRGGCRNKEVDLVFAPDVVKKEEPSSAQQHDPQASITETRLAIKKNHNSDQSDRIGLETSNISLLHDSGIVIEKKGSANDNEVAALEVDDGVTAMEHQIASMEAAELAQDTKIIEDVDCEIHLESDHAAYNLERELNGEPVECKKFKESLLRVEPSFVVVDPIPEPSPEPRPSKAELKKNSASNRVKTSLLQRMAEGHEVDVDATNAAASENDYRNTFCYLCRIDFSSSKGLYLHNVKLHSEGEVQCDVCFKPLKNRITLMKHKKLHLGAEDMHCMCTECGRPFKDKRALTAHITYTRHMLSIPTTSRS